ncbi:MAG TPA: 3-hydroxyacyl-CoA dehydrogenase NAD-binding domain-containing protein [Candidatus Acidoferrales bacterium]|nr:3-hydroxyacyl-CoA dehydrogenase NAD-binding domain-containing protein [Candidatus Acidoferrales bacterium]
MRAVGIAGTGTMGVGIAISFARSGWDVLLFDVEKENVAHALEVISKEFQREVDKGRIKAEDAQASIARIHPRLVLADFAEAHLVVEAVSEDIAVKRELFAKLDEISDPSVPLTSNTSSLSIGAIAQNCKGRNRIAGLHFFNPAHKMKLVEVVKTDFLSEEIGVELAQIVRQIGKTPVLARDTPGFVVNRCARHFYLEPLRFISERAGSIEEIDFAFESSNFPMGPFRLLDLVGLDVNLLVSKSIYEQFFFEPRFRPVVLQQKMIEAGLLGRKTGEGFYFYNGKGSRASLKIDRRDVIVGESMHEMARKISGKLELKNPLNDMQHFILARTISMIVNEAFFMLEEGVAAAEDIDLAMKLGTNFPKGPLELADSIGKYLIAEFLQAMRRAYGDIYRPSLLMSN